MSRSSVLLIFSAALLVPQSLGWSQEIVQVNAPRRALAMAAIPTEYKIKAAMICNFIQFVEWPSEAFSSPDAPLVVGIVAPNPFGDMLEQLTAGKSISGRPIRIKYLSDGDRVENCHAVFVPAAQEAGTAKIMQQIGNSSVLSIGETDSFLNSAGMIRFYTEDNKLRFEINPDAAESARLRISAKLLKLAKITRSKN
jgi:YfiR/HmsC-like